MDFSQNFNFEKLNNSDDTGVSYMSDAHSSGSVRTQKGFVIIVLLIVFTLISYQFVSKRNTEERSYYNFSTSIQDMINNSDL